MPILRSISGLRATTNDGALTPELVARHVRAFAALQPEGVIAVGHDGRVGGDQIAELVCQELCAVGRDVLDLGCVPTPTVQLLVERTHAAGGIIVTASHNGAEWNGLKFLDADGVFLLPDRARRLWAYADVWAYADAGNSPKQTSYGRHYRHSDPIGEHLAALGQVALVAAFRAGGGLEGARVALDAVNASGSRALVRLIEWLGGQPHAVFCDGSGIFPHPPEPLPEHVATLRQETRSSGAAIGLAVDPDADRLVLVHRSGEPVSEEKTVVLAIEAVLRAVRGGTVVVNASTTAEVELVANRYGGRVFRSPVGEINVVLLMRSCGAIIGGEGSGGVIYPACHWGRDSLVGASLVLSLWRSLSEAEWDERLLDSPFAMGKRRIAVNGDFPLLLDRIRAAFGDAPVVWDGDGLRFAWRDRWVHIRPSNTEPIVRVIAESPSQAETAELLSRAEQILRSASDA